MTSRVAACTARGTDLDYCRIRHSDKILHMIRLDKKKKKKKKTDPLNYSPLSCRIPDCRTELHRW